MGVNYKICSYCQNVFDSNAGGIMCERNSFCSANCKDQYDKRHGLINIEPATRIVMLPSARTDRRGISKCAFCGKDFHKINIRQKYCCQECSRKAQESKRDSKRTEIRKCAFCGNEFTWYSSRPNQKYCSKDCSHSASAEKYSQVKRPILEVVKTCAICGKEYIGYSNKSTQKYCSDECKKIAQSQRISKYTKKADVADPFIDALYQDVSMKVTALIQASNLSGISFGGRVLDYRLIGDIPEDTRYEVLKRDGNECYICTNESNLHIHHIVKRRNGGDHSKDNLITLCASCHRHIETGDRDFAIKRCFKNAQKHYHYKGLEEATNDSQEDQSVINALYELFNSIERTDSNKEILTKLDLIIEKFEEKGLGN